MFRDFPGGVHRPGGLPCRHRHSNCQMRGLLGVDAINVTASGTDSKLSQSVEPMYYPQG